MKTRLYYYAAVAVIAAMAMLGCSSAGAENKGKTAVKTLSSNEFYAKVYDLPKNAEKYLGDKPAIVDFYASWCGPCRAISPVLEELAKEYEGKIVIYKVDVDASPELANAFGIRSIPAILYIPLEGQPSMTLGSRDKSRFVKEINSILLGK